MSDPRYTGPNSDPLLPRGSDPIEPRRPQRDAGNFMWGWVAALIGLAVVIALVAGYYRHEPATASRDLSPTPATTGAAPSSQRPDLPIPAAPTPMAPASPAAPTPAPISPAAPLPTPQEAPHP